MTEQPVVAAGWAQSAATGAAAVIDVRYRGGLPSPERCATQWNAMSPAKQASLDRAGFDVGCYGGSRPDVVTFAPDGGPSPTGTP